MNTDTMYDAIVIGGGPAGLTAGIYLSRARLKTLIISEGTIGGQTVLTHEIANYPGVLSTHGYQLAHTMKQQAVSFGCTIVSNISIDSMNLSDTVKTIRTNEGDEYRAKTIILATGGKPRTLNVDGEELFKGRGISYCATCDGDFFTDKNIIVVGGGNSALEEAVSLTQYASHVTIVHQFDHFQAFEHAIAEVNSHPKIDIILNSTISAFIGNDALESVEISNLVSGERYNFKTDGVFIFIGYVPNTHALESVISVNTQTEILTDAII